MFYFFSDQSKTKGILKQGNNEHIYKPCYAKLYFMYMTCMHIFTFLVNIKTRDLVDFNIRWFVFPQSTDVWGGKKQIICKQLISMMNISGSYVQKQIWKRNKHWLLFLFIFWQGDGSVTQDEFVNYWVDVSSKCHPKHPSLSKTHVSFSKKLYKNNHITKL